MTHTVPIIPQAPKIMPVFQKLGYKTETAIADLVDNSISAKATIVNIDFNWNQGTNASIVIRDTGLGMSQEDLIKSMELAGLSDKVRTNDDLGRFGIGLKSAGFSLGNKLTLISKKDSIISNCSWDLTDYADNKNINSEFNGWCIDVDIDDSEIINKYTQSLLEYESGTILIIEKLTLQIDYKNLDTSQKYFMNIIQNVENHLSLIYHRLLATKSLSITINETEKVEPWDPIYSVPGGEELMPYDTRGIKIRPYVLPRKANSDQAIKNLAMGSHTMRRLQGFYLYRNNRLIVYGTWFDIFKKDIGRNLARISIDITSDMDEEWKIDVKKSSATPPDNILKILQVAADDTSQASIRELGRHSIRQTLELRPHPSAIWEQRETKDNHYAFYVNKKHPLYLDIYNGLSNKALKDLFNAFILSIENCFPLIQEGLLSRRYKSEEESQDNIDVVKDIEELKKMVKAFRDVGYENGAIKEALQEFTNYQYLADKIDYIIAEVN